MEELKLGPPTMCARLWIKQSGFELCLGTLCCVLGQDKFHSHIWLIRTCLPPLCLVYDQLMGDGLVLVCTVVDV